MADELRAVSVLNGEVQAGHRVAYATRSGSWMEMNIARVVEVGERDHPWVTGEKNPILKVRVEQCSGGRPSSTIRTLDQLDRVVKL
jgi:hypothetical protein